MRTHAHAHIAHALEALRPLYARLHLTAYFTRCSRGEGGYGEAAVSCPRMRLSRRSVPTHAANSRASAGSSLAATKLRTARAACCSGWAAIQLAIDDHTLDALVTFDADAAEIEDRAAGEPDAGDEIDTAPVAGDLVRHKVITRSKLSLWTLAYSELRLACPICQDHKTVCRCRCRTSGRGTCPDGAAVTTRATAKA
jgi:hypothetical protein